MKDFIMEDLHNILEEEDSLGDFLKMNDVSDMYKFCKDRNPAEEKFYTEEEFENKIDDIVNLINKSDLENSEW